MKLRKVTAIGLTAAITVAVLAGCGESGGTAGKGDDTSTTDEDAAAKAESGTPEDVTIWYYWETEGHQVALDKVI